MLRSACTSSGTFISQLGIRWIAHGHSRRHFRLRTYDRASTSVESLSRSVACAKANAPSRSSKVFMTLQAVAYLNRGHRTALSSRHLVIYKPQTLAIVKRAAATAYQNACQSIGIDSRPAMDAATEFESEHSRRCPYSRANCSGPAESTTCKRRVYVYLNGYEASEA